MLPVISYKGRKILFGADLIPSVGHIKLPYIMAYDMQPLLSMEEKKEVLEWVVENNAVVILQHDPVNECCTLKKTERGIVLAETATLSQVLELIG